MDLQTRNNQIFAVFCVWYLGLLVLAIAVVHGLVDLYQAMPHHAIVQLPLIAGHVGHPKPCENFVFIASCFLISIFSALVITVVARRAIHMHIRWLRPLIGLWVVMLTVIALVAFHDADFVVALMNHRSYGFLGISLVLFMLIWHYDLKRISVKQQPKWKAGLILLMFFLLISFAFRLLDINNLTVNYSGSIDASIYSVSQAIMGKVPLVAYPAQYGYYSGFIGPFLALIGGHSLFALSLIFTGILLFAFAALFYVMDKMLRSASVFFFSGLAVLFLNTTLYLWVAGSNDPYYQYNPLRFFWPCLSVLMFYIYAKKPSTFKAAVFSILSGLAIIWNADTGIPIAGAFLGFLLLKILFLLTARGLAPQFKRKRLLQLCVRSILHLFLISLCFGAFFGLIALKSGGAQIHYEWLDKYQHIFYIMGFAMLPTPLSLSPWMVVIAVYLFGMVFSQFYWHKQGISSLFLDLLLYLSILGVGVFAYYTGRSHIDNLLVVMWPAIVVSALLVDRLFYLVRKGLISKILLILTVPFWVLVLAASVNALSVTPKLVKNAHLFFTYFSVPKDKQVASEIAFIKKEKQHNSECVILSQRQGIYYLEADLASPVTGPGLVETLLLSDRDHLVQQILTHPSQCLFYGMGPASAVPAMQISLQDLLLHYKIKAKNSEGSMLFLIPIH